MISLIFWVFFAAFCSFGVSSSIDFDHQVDNIVLKYNEVNLLHDSEPNKKFNLRIPVNQLLKVDPIIFFKNVQRNRKIIIF
jgi:hypothetical protein